MTTPQQYVQLLSKLYMQYHAVVPHESDLIMQSDLEMAFD